MKYLQNFLHVIQGGCQMWKLKPCECRRLETKIFYLLSFHCLSQPFWRDPVFHRNWHVDSSSVGVTTFGWSLPAHLLQVLGLLRHHYIQFSGWNCTNLVEDHLHQHLGEVSNTTLERQIIPFLFQNKSKKQPRSAKYVVAFYVESSYIPFN